MKQQVKPLALVLIAILSLLLVGCGGGGSSPTNAFSGVYTGAFSRSIDSKLLVAIAANGTTEGVVSDANGLIGHDTGTTDNDGVVSVIMTGPLTGAFVRSPGFGGRR